MRCFYLWYISPAVSALSADGWREGLVGRLTNFIHCWVLCTHHASVTFKTGSLKQESEGLTATIISRIWKSGDLEIWGFGNPEMWGPRNKKIRIQEFSKLKSVQPKMSARSALVGKNIEGLIWGHLRPFVPWTGGETCQKFAYFPWWANGPYPPEVAIFCRFNQLHTNISKWRPHCNNHQTRIRSLLQDLMWRSQQWDMLPIDQARRIALRVHIGTQNANKATL